MNGLVRYFGVHEAGSTVRREVVGGVTAFATMSYIVFVQPAVLHMAGMDFGGVLVATCLSSAFACLTVICLIGLFVERVVFATLERRTVERWGLKRQS